MSISMSPNAKEDESGRIKFKSGVPQTIANLAGNKCSVPRCKNPTTGPFKTVPRNAVNMGTACHIYSAAKKGPRGRGGKDKDFLSSAENGIWCCNYHGSLIDKAGGADYSAETLFSWKKLAEARVIKQMDDNPSPLGWVDTIEFSEFPNKTKLPSVKLARCTLLFGECGAGKTALMEAAASVSNSRHANRFLGKGEKHFDSSFKAKVVYSTVDYLSKEVTLDFSDKILVRTEGNTPCLLPPGDLEILYLANEDCVKNNDEDDVEFFTRILGVDESVLFSLAKIGTKTLMPGQIKFEQDYDEDDYGDKTLKLRKNRRPHQLLHFKQSGHGTFLTFEMLSGGERASLILDLLITKAIEVCKQRLTLLLIDDLVSSFDAINFERLLCGLSAESFQAVVTLPYGLKNRLLENNANKDNLKNLDYLLSWNLEVIEK